MTSPSVCPMSESVEPALVLVATPIGNPDDLAPRALLELERADRIACEDTRRTGALLKHFGIAHDPFIVCNEHTEMTAAAHVVDRIAGGERIVLVSDAGMPGISDPGRRIVQAAADAGQTVTAVPGPSAVLMAVAVSGLVSDRFCFEGFLPRKGAERGRRIGALQREDRSTVFFESPRRVLRTIKDLADALGADRRVVLARELTKTHEEVWRGSLGAAKVHLAEREPLGEFVIVVDAAPPTEVDDDTLRSALDQEFARGSSTRDAVAAVMDRFDVPKRRVYDLAVDLRT